MSNGTRIGTWAVTLQLTCGSIAPLCPAVDSATVGGPNCELARTGAMRVMRYRGWLLGRGRPTLCPEHAGPMPVCGRCAKSCPSEYLSSGSMDHLFAQAGVQRGTRLCPECQHWAREVAFAAVREERARRMRGSAGP